MYIDMYSVRRLVHKDKKCICLMLNVNDVLKLITVVLL